MSDNCYKFLTKELNELKEIINDFEIPHNIEYNTYDKFNKIELALIRMRNVCYAEIYNKLAEVNNARNN